MAIFLREMWCQVKGGCLARLESIGNTAKASESVKGEYYIMTPTDTKDMYVVVAASYTMIRLCNKGIVLRAVSSSQ